MISGGQTAADLAGVRAAKWAGLATGGTMPKGFGTRRGPRPFDAQLSATAENDSSNYGPRTWDNVRNADDTCGSRPTGTPPASWARSRRSRP